MKTIITVFCLLLVTTQVMALDLNVYGGKYFGQKNFGLKGSDNPQFVSGILVQERFAKGILNPYVGVETLMDGQNSDKALGFTSSFHPTSIKYLVGTDVMLYKGFGVKFEHMCWHAIGETPYKAATEQYSMIQVFWKAHYEPFK